MLTNFDVQVLTVEKVNVNDLALFEVYKMRIYLMGKG